MSMQVRLDLDIKRQPNDETCGPTCLHAIYRYYGRSARLEDIISEVPQLPTGGTLAVFLACHALRLGYRARIYTYNLNIFDPTWFQSPGPDLKRRLGLQLQHKRSRRVRLATEAYLQFLELGGELLFEDLTKALIRRYLNAGAPILTGLSATFLYRCKREYGSSRLAYCDLRGVPSGHFVILSGYDRELRTVQVADPLPNPASKKQKYEISIDRVVNAILLGIVTYDANLLIIQPAPSAHAHSDRR